MEVMKYIVPTKFKAPLTNTIKNSFFLHGMDDRGRYHEEIDSICDEYVVPGWVGNEVVAINHETAY
jgi:hypothetical protein